MIELLKQLSWPELRHHPWRNAAALLAVMLGVALAFSVQLINQSALSEFSSAVRSVNGQPDFELRGQRGGFDEALYERVATHAQVDIASPVVEIDTFVIDAQKQRVPMRVLGIDPLVAGPLSPALMPQPAAGVDRAAMFDERSIFINGPARLRLNDAKSLRLQSQRGLVEFAVRGGVAAGGVPIAVIDIATAQERFGWLGKLSRIDVRLKPGTNRSQVIDELKLPEGVRAASPDEGAQRVSNVSRAYRVNLTVLALVALFTGAFLVFSILSLSVAKRQPQLALLGVLGLSARQRMALVLAESALLGCAGSLVGLLLGTALAALGLRMFAGDLGGGYFPGIAPPLHFDVLAALLYFLLGVAAAVLGGWVPARNAQRMAPAQALKGLGTVQPASHMRWFGPALLLASLPLALLPPIAEMPLAAYLSVACLLLGGIACVPSGIGLLLRTMRPPENALALLAVERARHQRQTATVAVAGVVASLSLAVALTVMVASFRDSVTRWLDALLPADLYAHAATSGGAGDIVVLPPALVNAAAKAPGVTRAKAQRVASITLDPQRPAVGLIARDIDDPATELPLVSDLLPAPKDATPIYVSEALSTLYRLTPGARVQLPLPDGRRVPAFVRAVWRDYVRQHGAITMHLADYRRLTADDRVNDIAIWLAPKADVNAVQATLREAARKQGLDDALLEFAAPGEIRAVSLRIFDRSFAVTYWLQAVAIAIGLFGIAASFSAQVLARRKEFGLLSHLGLTRQQVLTVVGAEGAVWTAAGALVGLLLGIGVSVVLVHVVNPQSFHWTMDMLLPWGRLLLLCAAVIIAGTSTALLAGRSAASRDMALAVKEDW
ncbi:FtsX-like permease family protein [Piscinibacter terrae]|uniref:ABC transporter permease n=1 Tax=Piscinibacter terrae TaxID=2496871 RepID=A0A3N7HWS5_9BURK|nr:ABC transporter permease [Albitalea terrae]RQP25876.1 ABC transporter permease [Albitalea terrae]